MSTHDDEKNAPLTLEVVRFSGASTGCHVVLPATVLTLEALLTDLAAKGPIAQAILKMLTEDIRSES